MVATLSVFETGRPHEEQKRTLSDNSIPQVAHLGIGNSRYSLLQSSGVGRQAAGVRARIT